MALDADRFVDPDTAIACWIEHVDFAARCKRVVRLLEGAAGRGEGAGIGVAALRGNEDALRVRRFDVESERKHECSEEGWRAALGHFDLFPGGSSRKRDWQPYTRIICENECSDTARR